MSFLLFMVILRVNNLIYFSVLAFLGTFLNLHMRLDALVGEVLLRALMSSGRWH